MTRPSTLPLVCALSAACLFACPLAAPDAPGAEAERCLAAPKGQGSEIARIGSTALTTEKLLDKIRSEGPLAMKTYEDPEQLLAFIEDQIRFELLAFAALERGLERDPEVIDAARTVMVRKLLEHDLNAEDLVAPINEKRIERYYRGNENYYRQPEMRRFAHIALAATPEGEGLARKLIAGLNGKGASPRLFREFALEHSVDQETRLRGGESLFKTREDLEASFGASFAAKVFAAADQTLIDEPVQSTRGWHVVKVVATRPELLRPLEEVRGEIREKLRAAARAEAFDEYLARLRKRYPVSLRQERIPDLAARLRRQDQGAASDRR